MRLGQQIYRNQIICTHLPQIACLATLPLQPVEPRVAGSAVMQMQAKTSQCLKGAALVQPRVQPRAARRSSTAVRAAETKESKPKAEKKPFSPPALDGKRHQKMCCP